MSENHPKDTETTQVCLNGLSPIPLSVRIHAKSSQIVKTPEKFPLDIRPGRYSRNQLFKILTLYPPH